MKNEGIIEAEQGEYDFWECGYGDTWVSHFEGRKFLFNEEGKKLRRRVDGTVCCGLMKGCTICWE